MKNFVFCFLALGLLSGCQKTFRGSLLTEENRPIAIRDDRGVVTIQPGKLKVTLRNGSVAGDGVMELKTVWNRPLAVITIPRAVAVKAVTFHLTPQDIHQSFGLDGHMYEAKPITTHYLAKDECTYCGFCYVAAKGATEAQMIADNAASSVANSCSCNGTQTVMREDISVTRRFIIDFKQDGRKTGVFTSEPIIDKSSNVIQKVTPCS